MLYSFIRRKKKNCFFSKTWRNCRGVFAGAGPFALSIAKSKDVNEIVAIELNDIAVKYLEENIKLNHVEEIIKPILGDVKTEAQKYPNYFDRVVMPLPKSSELFLDSAIFCKEQWNNPYL